MTSILKVDELQDTSGNLIIKEDSNTITIGASGDTTNIIGTLQNNGSAVGGANTPAVSAYMNATQNVSDNAFTKIEYNTELFDTDSAYDHSSNYRFTVPSGKAGKYFIHASVYQFGNNNDVDNTEIDIYLNGSRVRRSQVFYNYTTSKSTGGSINISATLDLSASDYIEIYGKLNVNSGTAHFYGAAGASDRYSIVEIFKLVE